MPKAEETGSGLCNHGLRIWVVSSGLHTWYQGTRNIITCQKLHFNKVPE